MLKILMLIVLAIFGATTAMARPPEVQIARYNLITGVPGLIPRNTIALKFSDGKAVRSVSIRRSGKDYYLVREGGRPGFCHSEWTRLQQRNGYLLLRGSTAATDTCSGNPCNSCQIMTGSGRTMCKCNEAGAGKLCNHSTTQLSVRAIVRRTGALNP